MNGETDGAAFFRVLADLRRADGVALDVFGRVLERVTIAAPDEVSQAEIARGNMLNRPTDLSPATVSRAVSVLQKENLMEQRMSPVRHGGRPAGHGRPGSAWALDGARYGVIGVHLAHGHGAVTGLTARLTTLGLDDVSGVADVSRDFGQEPRSVADVADEIAFIVNELSKRAADTGRQILGAGVEIGGHVYDGQVVLAENAGWDHVELAQQVSDRTGIATVVENDVNARALLLAYGQAFNERDFAVAAVFDEGVGGALILDGRLSRGAGGVAGEIGHLFVDYEASGDAQQGGASKVQGNAKGFGDRCSCGRRGHVDALATPKRIIGQLAREGLTARDLSEAASAPLIDDDERLTRQASVFRRAGTALGRALANLANIVNPARIVLILPPALGTTAAGTAATAYLTAVEAALDEAFSTAALNARAGDRHLTVTTVAADDVGRTGAKAAGALVLHAFIEAARNRRVLARRPRTDATRLVS